MSKNVTVDRMADEIMVGMEEYAGLAAEDVKTAVRNAAKAVKQEISKTAPRRTGHYAKSWAVKTKSETSNGLTCVVYSRDRAWLAHLLEHGHAKRGGGRVAARPHIAPAQKVGEKRLEEEIEVALRK